MEDRVVDGGSSEHLVVCAQPHAGIYNTANNTNNL